MGWKDYYLEAIQQLSSIPSFLEPYVSLSPELQQTYRQWTLQHTVLFGTTAGSCFVLGFALGRRSSSSSSLFPKVYRNVRDIPTSMFQNNSSNNTKSVWLRGRVLSVSDGDTIRWYHAPTRWHSSSSHNKQQEKLSDVTIPVRICTIDTPETAKFGNPGQPYGDMAHQYLSQLLLGNIAYIRLLNTDQYGRVVAEVKTRRSFFSWPPSWACKHADEYMLKAGLAEVYTGSGAVYGHKGKDHYVQLQTMAQKAKIGMWKQEEDQERESASQYKARIKASTTTTSQ